MPRLSKIGAAALGAFGWTSGVSAVTVDFLVVAGGGGGATAFGAGGGAGGFRTSAGPSGGGASAEAKLALNPTLSYTVIVGAGGNGALGSTQANNTNGSNSSISTITSTGGGAGGTNGSAGATGGSGGAGGNQGGISAAAGAGTANQGFAGGTGSGSSSYGSGGGGGAGGIGGTGTTSVCGDGGVGVPSSISGTSTYYAGGGGGGATSVFGITTAGLGGNGGGGSGSNSASSWVGYAGEANKGGGGGGGGYTGTWQNGGQGGSGVVIISYVGAQQFGGGVVTSSGGNTIHTFNTSGTLSPLNSLTANFLVVAGGGGGGGGNGGGGAGGLLSGSGLTLDTNSIYAVTVGAGGTAAGASAGGNGGNSSFSMVSTTAVGGGGGGYQGGTTTGASGGSGGGGSYVGSAAGGTGTAGQGNNGGSGIFAAVQYGGGGGGGANAVGANGTSTAGGNGGSGLQNPITGSTTGELSGGIYYLAGGGGGGANTASAGTGGLGGGGAGGINSGVGTAGTPNTGGGGGGGATTGAATFSGGAGGSGIVIISYPGSTQQMAGGTVTVAGGNVIHTFTSSGYLTPIVLVNNSLRFRESASSYLNRTPTTAGNNQKFTMSVWYKPGNIGTSFTNANFISAGGDGSNIIIAGSGAFGSTVDNRFLVRENNATAQFYWPMVFRDPAAWYHIVLAVDTTQTNSNNRAKLYVNGVDQGAFSGTGYSLSATTSFNTVTAHYIGAFNSAYYYTSCYFAEYNWIDGQQLTPNSFGTFNGLGVWQPIRYGGSYGTNGFYLPFTASTSSTYAGSFNASNQSLSTPNASQFSLGSSDFTVEAWVYLTNSSTSTNNNVLNQSDGGAGSNSAFFFGVGSNGVALYLSTTGTSWTNFINGGSVIPQQNRWYHIVWQRSGNTIQTFVNGVLSNSDTFSGTVNTSTRNIEIGCQNNAGSFFGGYISNVRLVKGVAVYTNGFTPPTANLSATQSAGVNISAITGTQTSYLTLQNSSIVDNSTFAVTITNNNGVATSVQYPFVTQAFNDKGPAGNNWTPNNIGGLFGSSYDFMTDVPTLTSATTANYCVMNPLESIANPFSGTSSNGNLTVSIPAPTNSNGIASTIRVISAAQPKFYIETTVTSLCTFCSLGMVTGANVNYRIRHPNDITINANDVIMTAFDPATGNVWYGRNDTWLSSGNPSAGTNPYYTLTATETIGAGFTVVATNGSSGTFTTENNFGQRPFAYTPPTGFVALNTYNLPTPTIGATASTTANKYFDATLYTGNSSTQTVTNSGSMQPDFIWVKSRTYGSSHGLVDSVRGLASGLNSNATSSQTTLTDSITSINSNGFSLGADSTTWFNYDGSYVAWQWRASNATAVTNTAGSIISSVSANTTAGFSIVTYTGNATSGATVGHGCQVGGIATAPSMVILKSRTLGTNWYVYHSGLTSASYQVYLNLISGEDNSVTTAFNSVAPGATTFTLPGTGFGSNNSSATYVAYCFAPVAGYSAFGSYTGNGSGTGDGPFIYTGFRPRFVMFKNRTQGSQWILLDTARNTYNLANAYLEPNTPDTENTANTVLDILSNGFKLRNTGGTDYNESNNIYVYACFAENPFKYANAR